jgi:hypothetical protein
MIGGWLDIFRFYCEERNKQYVNEQQAESVFALTIHINNKERERWIRLEEEFRAKKWEVTHSESRIKIMKIVNEYPYLRIYYQVLIEWKIKQSLHYFEQSWVEERVCLLKEEEGWWVLEDVLVETEGVDVCNHPLPLDGDYEIRNPNERRARYNRKKAVDYAERWWNDYNPKFQLFEVDCTNYVSQCLYAGGAPMKYSSDRAKGWWYKFETPSNWSFSWTVAHSLRWYLPTSRSGLRGIEVFSADQLEPGDIICYDFSGDGSWQHTTIVVAKDRSGSPLVNAHSSSSRHRMWEYKDSYAWTEKTAYKFYRILDQFE